MKVYEITISFMNDLTGVFETTIDKALQNFEEEKGSSAYDIEVLSIIQIGGLF